MSLACIILAAGQGTRMKSSLPKVMHPVAGRPMVSHVVSACEAVHADHIVVVVAPDMDIVRTAVAPHPCAQQDIARGTGDAVKAARGLLQNFSGTILVVFGDTPLLTAASLSSLLETLKQSDSAIVVGGFLPDDPGAYGRLVVGEDGCLTAIVEAADATAEQKQIRLCNGGIMAFDSGKLWELLDKVKNDNAKGEYYLTDCVELARKSGYKVSVSEMPVDDVSGINNRVHLSVAEKIMQNRLRKALMESGVTMTDPDTVFLQADTRVAKDVVIGPNVVFGPDVQIDENVTIHAFSHLQGVQIQSGAVIGPFARLRPGTQIGAQAHIGNFVEIKKSKIAAGAKINHLSYIGDAIIGEKTNIGAGTITCNYDGYTKSLTEIGPDAFIGSDTALVAPVKVGRGAIVGAGSVITQDVPEDSLAIARGRQSVFEGRAALFRIKNEKRDGK